MGLGVAVATLPIGVLIRLAGIVALIALLATAWATRAGAGRRPGIWFHWILGLAVFFSMAWPRHVNFNIGGVGVGLGNFSLALGVFSCLFGVVHYKDVTRSIAEIVRRYRFFLALMLIWFSWRFIAAFLGENPLGSVVILIRELIFYPSMLVIGLCLCGPAAGVNTLARAVVVATIISAVFGIVEAGLGHNPLSKWALSAALAGDQESLGFIASEKMRGGSFRTQSIFTHPIVFAQFIVGAIPVCCWFAWRTNSGLERLICWLAVLLALASIGTSGSRSGLVGLLAVGLTVGTIWWWRGLRGSWRARLFAAAGLPVALLIGVGVVFVAQALFLGRSANEQGSTDARMQMLNLAFSELRSSPIHGFGEGSAIFKAGLTSSSGIVSIDSYLLNCALDSGYVGLVLMVLVFFVLFGQSIVHAVRSLSAGAKSWSLLIGSVVGVWTAFLGLSTTQNMSYLWLLIALLIATTPLDERDSRE